MRRSILFALALGFAASARAEEEAELVTLCVFPDTIRIEHAGDRPRLVVLAIDADGLTHDVTAEAEVQAPELVRWQAGRFEAVADGDGELRVRVGALEQTLPIAVRGAASPRETSFHRDVLPVLTHAGCNSGGCHGAASGKNGFRLSLFGFDAAEDHQRLTRELRGRRLDPARPEESLILTKPTVAVTHQGGKRLEPGGPSYETLRRWIAGGAPIDAPARAELASLEVLPSQLVIGGADRHQQLIVRAHYVDGTDRDVTELALLSSSNDDTAAISDRGVVTSGRPGEAYVMARFGTLAEVSQVIVLEEAAPPSWPEGVEAIGEIDRFIHDKLRKMRLTPAPVCSDEVFVRRVFLDVLGVLPTPAEVREFLGDDAPDKRQQLVDRLLRRPEFSDVWAMQWAEVLRVEADQLEPKGMFLYTELLREAFASDVPLDELVRTLLTSEGGNFTNPEANFYLTERDPKAIAENVSQVFLGIRIQCAQCHNHPFERWTMDDYYGFAAFFGRIATKRAEDPRETVVFVRGSGEVQHARDNRVVAPKFLGGAEPEIKPGQDRRAVLAEWLTSKDNPWFAANIANRVWARFFGRGLVEPVDDVRVSNPPSHPELHRWLGERLAQSGWDLRALIRDITASRTYQLAASADDVPASAFAKANVRRLTAEQLLEAIGQVTGQPTKFRGLPLGARATQVAGGSPDSYFLDTFGRPRRSSPCACERRNEPTLGQALHLINGPTLTQKLRHERGRLKQLLASEASDEVILETLYLSAYARPPRPDELEALRAEIEGAGDRAAVLEDVFWAILNSKEFLFTH
ncbi:MAG: DUF1549 and DUF1553 domain-containing protein [Planctomycetota bacterium]